MSMQHVQGMLLFLVLAVNSAWFEFYVVTRSSSSHPFLCALATVDAEVHSSSVSIVYIVCLHIVLSKAALQKKGSMEPMEPPLDLPLPCC